MASRMLVANHNFDREETDRVFHVDSGVLLNIRQKLQINIMMNKTTGKIHRNHPPREAPIEMGMRSRKVIDVILIPSSELAASFA
jgi:hypothetical protein